MFRFKATYNVLLTYAKHKHFGLQAFRQQQPHIVRVGFTATHECLTQVAKQRGLLRRIRAEPQSDDKASWCSKTK